MTALLHLYHFHGNFCNDQMDRAALHRTPHSTLKQQVELPLLLRRWKSTGPSNTGITQNTGSIQEVEDTEIHK